MTIAQALKFAAGELSARKINNPPLEAEILLSGLLKKPREFSLIHGEKKLSQPQIIKFKKLLKKRLRGEPIAYLIGYKEFYGLAFKVNKNVLIPRPETELMVEEALKLVTHKAKPVTLVDVGTGSGCVIITLTKLLSQTSKTVPGKFFGIDISAKALTVAKQNAKLHGLSKKINFLPGNLLRPILNSKFKIQNSEFIILANLPYGWPAWKNNCSMNTVGLKFEPKIALFTDKNGLGLYEKLFKQIYYLVHNKKYKRLKTLSALCEFDPRQTAKIKKLIKQELPQVKCQIKKDLAGLNRLAVITIKK